jgi:hypothetical protein
MQWLQRKIVRLRAAQNGMFRRIDDRRHNIDRQFSATGG